MKPAYNLVTKIKEKGFIGILSTVRNRLNRLNRLNRYCNSVLIRLRLKKLLHQTVMRYEVSNIDIEETMQRTLNYIEAMRIKSTSYGQYRYAKSQKVPVLYASLYAVLTRHLYNDLDNLTSIQRKEWINYIQSFQDDDGLFKDHAVENDIAANSDWWGWRHLTLHALMGLTALGAVAKKRFKIVEPFRDVDYTIKWLESRDWVIDPATTSNEIQNYFTMLQYARDFQGEGWADKTLSKGYECLNEKQDPETGLWGARFDSPIELSNGVQTGYHIWLLYFYDNRPIQYVEKIIDSCLATQNKLGGFGVPLNSSACEDIDSIDPLIRLSIRSGYRRQDVYAALQRAIPWILTNMNEDGGFVFRRIEPFTYGHQLMYSNKDESAMFPTWFRTLSLAYIAKAFPYSYL